MIDPTLLAALTGIVGAVGAMIWSFLMASKVAAPRAAKKSRLLLVNILTGASEEDKKILETIRGTLIRPEVERMQASLPQIDEESLAIDYEEMAKYIGPAIGDHVTMAFNQVRAQETKALQKQLDELGVEGVMDEAKGMIAEQLPPEMVQAQRILGMKVSKKYARENPIGAHLIEMAKLQLMQMMGGSMPSGAPPSESAPSGGSRGFGVR